MGKLLRFDGLVSHLWPGSIDSSTCLFFEGAFALVMVQCLLGKGGESIRLAASFLTEMGGKTLNESDHCIWGDGGG